MTETPGRVLDVEQTIEIAAAIEHVFEGLLARLTCNNVRPDGVPMPMVLEARPGGRWFRDLGEDTGHLWGFVQVIKPPTLLEINGPMFIRIRLSGMCSFGSSQPNAEPGFRSDIGPSGSLRKSTFRVPGPAGAVCLSGSAETSQEKNDWRREARMRGGRSRATRAVAKTDVSAYFENSGDRANSAGMDEL